MEDDTSKRGLFSKILRVFFFLYQEDDQDYCSKTKVKQLLLASQRTGAGHPGQQNGTLHGPADWVQYVPCNLSRKDFFFLPFFFLFKLLVRVFAFNCGWPCYSMTPQPFSPQGAGAGEPEAAAV